jgi:hypothetical protein
LPNPLPGHYFGRFEVEMAGKSDRKSLKGLLVEKWSVAVKSPVDNCVCICISVVRVCRVLPFSLHFFSGGSMACSFTTKADLESFVLDAIKLAFDNDRITRDTEFVKDLQVSKGTVEVMCLTLKHMIRVRGCNVSTSAVKLSSSKSVGILIDKIAKDLDLK